jgi:hypothetical protein
MNPEITINLSTAAFIVFAVSIVGAVVGCLVAALCAAAKSEELPVDPKQPIGI